MTKQQAQAKAQREASSLSWHVVYVVRDGKAWDTSLSTDHEEVIGYYHNESTEMTAHHVTR